MLVFGHTGITLGTATVLAGVAKSSHFSQINKISWLTALGSYLDIRILLIGSLLPDIIDKPLGQVFFKEAIGNGRIFSHTLLFLIIIAAAGYYLYRSRQRVWLLTLAGGTFMHLILDQMWNAPRTLFWPLLGLTFDKAHLANWLSNIFKALFGNPGVYIPEVIGFIVLLWFGVALIARKRVGVFIKYGKLN